jgi:hypothetical protein
MNRGRLRLAAIAGLAIPFVLALSPAAADDNFVDVVDGSGSVLLMPGSHASTDFVVSNEAGAPASLRVQATDVVEDDNGCVRPEQQSGDVTCGPGGGELGDWLQLQLRDVTDGGDQELWAGTVHDLENGVDALQSVAANGTPRLRLVVTLPRGATNDTMSDQTTFALRWTYTGIAVSAQTTVLGVQQGSNDGAGSHAGLLAATGSSVSLGLLALITGLLGLGSVLTTRSRRRRGASGAAA